MSTKFGHLITLGGINAVGSADYDVIVCCAKEFAPGYHDGRPDQLAIMSNRPFGDVGPLAYYIRLDDTETELQSPKKQQLVNLGARAIATHIAKGHRVLVHCAAGINRSALVLARSLMYPPTRLSGKQAVALVKQFRPQTFSNKSFAKYLERMAP